GVIITVVGVGLVLGEGALQAGGSARPWLGDLAAFGSALSAAACNVLYRPYLRKYSVLPVSAFAMLASVLFLALLAAGEGFFGALPRLSPGGWWAVGFIGVSSGIGYYLWLWALSHTTPTNATVYLALSPATAAGLGALLLGEHTSPTFLIGLAGSGLGLWLARLGDEESPVESGHGRRWWRSGA
ncbi:MAG: DMT family transporter, partial [Bacillota bacterium]